LYVYALSGKAVPANYLEINGEVIRDPSGNPYKVPADFDWNTYMRKFETFKHSLEARDKAEPSLPDDGTRAMRDTAEMYRFLIGQFHAAWPASSSDVQRTYNGYSGKGEGDFVPAFTPAASFLYGAACAASGLSEEECLAGGGAQNILSAIAARYKGKAGSIDTSGKYYNAPIPRVKKRPLLSPGTTHRGTDEGTGGDRPAASHPHRCAAPIKLALSFQHLEAALPWYTGRPPIQ
jgi:hypothetical protein